MARTVTIEVELGDILDAEEDVVALKFAQGFHGADYAVAEVLQHHGVRVEQMRLRPGEHKLLSTEGILAARNVLYVGVPRLGSFRYEQIRNFARSVLEILASETPDARSLAMTIHGPGYGLDEAESMLAQLGGYLEALQEGRVPERLRAITVYEMRPDRAERVWRAIERQLVSLPNAERIDGKRAFRLSFKPPDGRREAEPGAPQIEPAGTESETKPHAFVAMPFSKDMDDVYYYGIVQPVNAAGLLCERVDEASFTGHILDQIRERIETATVVIADLTRANPNVYLEVGYAWGRQKPTILLVQKVEDLRFDVAGQRCLIYERILDLEQGLSKELQHLQKKGVIPAARKEC